MERDYLITCDAAEGVRDAAWSVADVWDMKSWEQVAQYRAHVAPDLFGKRSYDLGMFYNWALIAVENNYPGNAVINELISLKYPNIYVDPENRDAETPWGWRTTEKSKSAFVSDGRKAVREMDLKLNSKVTINEMRTFCLLESGKMGPQPGCWQDTVIVSCKAASILKAMGFQPERVLEQMKDVKRKMGWLRRGLHGVGSAQVRTVKVF